MRIFVTGIFTVIAFVVSLRPGTATGQESFEGTFTYQIAMENPGQADKRPVKNEVDFYVKGSKTLIKNERANANYNFKMLVENQDEVFYILLNRNNRKVAMKQDLQTIQQRNQGKKDEEPEARFERTSKTKQIMGYECRLYKVNQRQFEGRAWITNELPLDQKMEAVFEVMQQHPNSQKGVGAISASNFPDDGVVMASTLEAKDGNQAVQSRMKAIQEKTINPQRFDISQYQIMNMTGATGSFGQ